MDESTRTRDKNIHHVFGETIEFPFEPYKTQLVLISKILQAIKQNKNALLESPTGTGKTIAVLSAVLAWKEKNLESKVPIIYATRTHSQLTQLIKELKQSPHRKNFSAICLASKERYCINEKISNSDFLSKECNAIKVTSCEYFFSHEKNVKSIAAKKLILDVEELYHYSKQNSVKACPYYTARGLASKENNIIFCPYNYILDPSMYFNFFFTLKEI